MSTQYIRVLLSRESRIHRGEEVSERTFVTIVEEAEVTKMITVPTLIFSLIMGISLTGKPNKEVGETDLIKGKTSIITSITKMSSNSGVVVFGPLITETGYTKLLRLIELSGVTYRWTFVYEGLGGHVSSLAKLYRAIEAQPTTLSVVTGNVYSSHAMLPFSGKFIFVAGNAGMYFHTVQFSHVPCTGSKEQCAIEDAEDAKFNPAEVRKTFEPFLWSVTKGIFTGKEIQWMTNNPDELLKLTGPEVVKRLQGRSPETLQLVREVLHHEELI